MGLPSNWRRVEDWIYHSSHPSYISHDIGEKSVTKWPQIPSLSDYSIPPEESFWAFFPCRPLPTRAETDIDVNELQSEIEKFKECMTCHQLERSLKAVEYLKNGAPSF